MWHFYMFILPNGYDTQNCAKNDLLEILFRLVSS